MPPKRKTSTKKKGKKGGASAKKNGAATACTASLPPPPPPNSKHYITFEKYSAFSSILSGPSSNNWIFKNGYLTDPIRLARKLPACTVEALRNGSTTPEEVADELVSKMNYYEKNNPETMICHGVKCYFLNGWCLVVTEVAIPTTMASQQFRYSFFRDFNGRVRKENNGRVLKENPCPRTFEECLHFLKQAFDETWREWGPRLDEVLYSGQSGASVRECQLFDSPMEDFLALTRKEFICVEDYSVVRCGLRSVAQRIADSLDQVKNMCWQCGVPMQTRYACARCDAALYCSRKCQVLAWKEGHKSACRSLKVKHAFWEGQLRVVDMAHSLNNGLLESGLQLNFILDHELLFAFSSSSFQGLENGIPEHQIPRMEIFYQNLQRIENGEWWIYTESDSTTTLSEYYDWCRRMGKTLAEERHQFLEIGRLISIDTFKQGTLDGRGDDPCVIRNRYGVFPEVKRTIKDFGGVAMPPERFLELYKDKTSTSLNFQDEESARKYIRRKHCAEVFMQFRKEDKSSESAKPLGNRES